MTTPAILFNDIPVIHYWGSTAPVEDGEELELDPNPSLAPIEQDDRIIEEHNQVDAESDSDSDSEDGHMETIFAEPSSDQFVMIPANIYGETQDSDSLLDSQRMNTSIERRNNDTNTGSEGKAGNVFSTFLDHCRLYIQPEDSPHPQHDKKQSPIHGANRRAPSRSSNIYSSYDWVSEVVVDDEGRRLILPGQVVVMGEESQGEAGFSDSQDPSCATETDPENPAAPNSRRADLSSIFETSTIMVSAHDLLATQNHNSEQDALEFEQIPRGSQHASLTTFPGYHTAAMSTKIARGLRRFAVQKLDRVHHNLVFTSSRLTNGVTSRLYKVETKFHILATVSDIAIQSCDWLFPTSIRELEEGDGAPMNPIADEYVAIEMAMLETQGETSTVGHPHDMV
ncbi:MAG: hypothetical protein SGBAC_012935 [Bacillariaceae sp.]